VPARDPELDLDESDPLLRVWVDAQLPPVLARWLAEEPGVEAAHTFTLGYTGASDRVIFEAARAARAVVITKDIDFVTLLDQRGPPPQIVWVTTGNVTNAALQALVFAAWSKAVTLLRNGTALVELGDRR
jgi:predicted nuclease of predicted toxin-antitoxin system